MAIPANVKTKIQASSRVAHANHMQEVKGNISSSSNIVRHSAARQIDEPSPQQARAIDKILRLPK
jgi:hypothetical protein